MILTLMALSKIKERENHRYLNASPQEKGKIMEEWGMYKNPTEEQLKRGKDHCDFENRLNSNYKGILISIIPSFVAGLATAIYTNPKADSLEALLPALAAVTTIGAIMYANRKISNFLHRRRHPTARECNEEYLQRGLAEISELENSTRVFEMKGGNEK